MQVLASHFHVVHGVLAYDFTRGIAYKSASGEPLLLIQTRMAHDVYATSSCSIDLSTMSCKRHVPAGNIARPVNVA